MPITPQEAHQIAVYAGQGDTRRLAALVRHLAAREAISPAQVLMACKDDFQQTAAHTAAKGGQIRSIETLASLLGSAENRTAYFNQANRFTGDRPVHTAMRHGYLAVLQALVAHGADPTAPNRFGDRVTDYVGDFEPWEVQRVVDRFVETRRGG